MKIFKTTKEVEPKKLHLQHFIRFNAHLIVKLYAVTRFTRRLHSMWYELETSYMN